VKVRDFVAACAVAAALAAVACGDSVTGPGAVTGPTWRLLSLQRADASVVAPPAGTFTLRFAEEGRLEVRADGNGCGGSYQISGDGLDVGTLACTRAFCASAPFDTEYATLVESATTVERRDDVLILRSPAGVLRFVH
jgi:heat shock protein HslJ